VRLSDRNEAELNKLAKSLDEKNSMLEGLSNKLSKYLSPQVYQSIFSGGRDVKLSTERKKLTVFFSDIKDFTQTTDDLQPEDLTYLLNKYFTEMSKIALEHGATIDKFIGDAMLMFFGDPESRGIKEDARACVRMAIAMQRKMAELREIWHDKGYEHPFQMRVGINTGFCNVGNFGSDDRMDYTIIGGDVNLAARLEGQADPSGILMSYETYALVKGHRPRRTARADQGQGHPQGGQTLRRARYPRGRRRGEAVHPPRTRGRVVHGRPQQAPGRGPGRGAGRAGRDRGAAQGGFVMGAR